MALVNHVHDLLGGIRLNLVAGHFRADKLVVDQEQLEGVDRADDQIVVAVLAVIEMEAPQLALGQEQGDDVLDVGTLCMVAQVDQYLRLRSHLDRHEMCHAPIGQVSMIESRLVKLILDEHARVGRQRLVRGGKHLFHTPEAIHDVILAGIVGAVGQPDAEPG